MSDIHNHILCGSESLALLKNQALHDLITAEYPLYKLGCMGGDIFYYYDFIGGGQTVWTNHIGNFFHREVNDFFAAASQFLQTVEPNMRKKLSAYLMGFVCHHALDAQTHPFINYFAGCRLESKPETARYQYTHKRFEVILDVLYSEFLHRPMPNVLFTCDLSEQDKSTVLSLLQHILKQRGEPMISEAIFQKSLGNYERLVRIGSNWKNLFRLLSVWDKITRHSYRFSRPFFFVTERERKLDPLNLERKFWRNPCDPNERNNYNYPELFDYAVKNSARRMEKYNQYLQGKRIQTDDIFGNLDYVTGCSEYTKEDICFMDVIL